MKNQKLLIVLAMFISSLTFGQNARFSQIWSAPIQFNPSLTGRFDGKYRLSALYSNQSADFPVEATLNHQNVSFDAKFGKYKASGDEAPETKAVSIANPSAGKDEIYSKNRMHGYWGAGLNYYHYGYKTSPFDATFISASLARHFYNKSNKYFGFGIQGTYASGKLDETKGTAYDMEISGGGFRYPTPSTPNGATIGTRKSTKTYVDFNGGAYYGMNTEAVMFELGGAMHHLFYPLNDAMGSDSESKLRHRITAHSILRLKLNPKWGIVQRNMYWQEGLYYRSKSFNDSLQIVSFWTGLEFYKIDPSKKINLNFGFYTRSFRTLMPYLNLNVTNFANIRYSYEQPINSKKFYAYNAKRSELALIFTYKRYTSPGTRFYRKTNFW